jgi:hypothetical protein
MGCATGTTWHHTGFTINTVNHAEVKKTANGEIELLQHVTQKKVYLPYTTYAPFGVSDIKQKWQYPLQKKPENSISYTFRLRPDKKQPVRVSKLKGFLYFNEKLSSRKMFVNKLNPADIALMKENPFVIRFLSATERNHFVIPYAIKQENSGEIRLQCYTPMKPRVIFPYERNNIYEEKMNGAGITLLRIAMLPIPLVVDTVTFPLQFLYLILVHGI